MNPIKKLLTGTSLESPARSVKNLFKGNKNTVNVPDWVIRTKRDDDYMDNILKKILNRSSSCVDIGAHRGYFLKRFIELSPEGRHFAFEALPEFAKALREKFPTVNIFNYALGNQTGFTKFCYVKNLPGWSGLKKQDYPEESNVEMIEVEMKKLDEVLSDEGKIDFIKIDVEGAEYEVLEGSEKIISKYKPVVLFEHAKIHNAEYDTTPEKIYNLIVEKFNLGIFSLDGTGPLNLNDLTKIYNTSFESKYDRNAQTNFLAKSV